MQKIIVKHKKQNYKILLLYISAQFITSNGNKEYTRLNNT